MKRILTVQDMTLFGKCSTAVSMPVISAAGVECCALPTSLFSTHSAYPDFISHSLTALLPDILAHWEKENLSFDAVLIGYLGGEDALEIAQTVIDRYRKKGAKIILDPAMADGGRLYSKIPPSFPEKMAKLCEKADLILPNLTEACLLCGEEVREDYDEAFVISLLQKMCELGAKTCAVTGITLHENSWIGTACYTPETDDFYSYFKEKLPKSFHGTGDLFSACTAAVMTGEHTTEEAIRIASDFVHECIRLTPADRAGREGVLFEDALPFLMKLLHREAKEDE